MTFAISCFPLRGRGIKREGLIEKKKNPLSKLYLFAFCSKTISLSPLERVGHYCHSNTIKSAGFFASLRMADLLHKELSTLEPFCNKLISLFLFLYQKSKKDRIYILPFYKLYYFIVQLYICQFGVEIIFLFKTMSKVEQSSFFKLRSKNL